MCLFPNVDLGVTEHFLIGRRLIAGNGESDPAGLWRCHLQCPRLTEDNTLQSLVYQKARRWVSRSIMIGHWLLLEPVDGTCRQITKNCFHLTEPHLWIQRLESVIVWPRSQRISRVLMIERRLLLLQSALFDVFCVLQQICDGYTVVTSLMVVFKLLMAGTEYLYDFVNLCGGHRMYPNWIVWFEWCWTSWQITNRTQWIYMEIKVMRLVM